MKKALWLLALVLLLAAASVLVVVLRKPAALESSAPVPAIREAPKVVAPSEPTSDTRCVTPFPDPSLFLGGTLVLSDAADSVSLIHVRGVAGVAVRKGELFGDRAYELIAVDRGEVCLRSVAQRSLFRLVMTGKTSPADLSGIRDAVKIQQSGEYAFKIPKALLKREMSNLPAILQSARAEPLLENGQFAGFWLKFVDESSIFRTLGLESGDVLKGANDITFTHPADGLRAYALLLNAANVEIHLVRQGRAVTLHFETQ